MRVGAGRTWLALGPAGGLPVAPAAHRTGWPAWGRALGSAGRATGHSGLAGRSEARRRPATVALGERTVRGLPSPRAVTTDELKQPSCISRSSAVALGYTFVFGRGISGEAPTHPAGGLTPTSSAGASNQGHRGLCIPHAGPHLLLTSPSRQSLNHTSTCMMANGMWQTPGPRCGRPLLPRPARL